MDLNLKLQYIELVYEYGGGLLVWAVWHTQFTGKLIFEDGMGVLLRCGLKSIHSLNRGLWCFLCSPPLAVHLIIVFINVF